VIIKTTWATRAGKGVRVVSKYPPEALEPENLAECIDDHGKKIRQLQDFIYNDLDFSTLVLKTRIDTLERQLKAVTELHLSRLEEHTEQVGIIIKMLKKPGKLSDWLARFGL
jgi:hypothetical protein